MPPAGRLRVAVVHSFYRSDSPSGENAMVEAQVAALGRHGHEVRLFAVSSDDMTRSGSLRAALTVASGAGPNPRAEIERWSPDVVHLHNTFPNLGRRWVEGLAAPVVATLHNYRPLCAAATLYRDGGPCTECRDVGRHRGLVHACYRRSRLATLPLTLGQRGAADPVLRSAQALVVLSAAQAAHYEAAGVPAERMHVVPNFVPDDLAPAPGPGGRRWLYAGRLTEDKGIVDAVRAWPDEVPLLVVGEGPAAHAVTGAARAKDVAVRGPVPRREVQELLRASRGLLFPSRWSDPFGLVYAEALAAGTPVLATHPSAAAQSVLEDGSGVSCEVIDPEVVRAADQRFPQMRGSARAAFERSYTEDAHVAALLAVYCSVVR